MFGLTMRLEESQQSTLKLQQTYNVAKLTAHPNMHHIIFTCFQISRVQIFENKKQSDMIFLHFLILKIRSLYSFRA